MYSLQSQQMYVSEAPIGTQYLLGVLISHNLQIYHPISTHQESDLGWLLLRASGHHRSFCQSWTSRKLIANSLYMHVHPVHTSSYVFLLIHNNNIFSITRQIWGIWKLRPAYSPETPNLGQNRYVSSRVTLKFDGWPWKTIGHLFFAVSSFVQHSIAIGEFKLELQSGNAQFESNSTIFRAIWPWNLTDDLEKQ